MIRFDLFTIAAEAVTNEEGRLGFVPLLAVTRELPGVQQAMLLLRAEETDSAPHAIGFGIEDPQGVVSALVGGDPDATPSWITEQMCMDGASGTPEEDYAPLRAVWDPGRLQLFPVGVPLQTPGEHRIFVTVDGDRELSRALVVDHGTE